MKKDYGIICFDADDTLWVNEPYYRSVEKEFIKLISGYGDEGTIEKDLHDAEIKNLGLYGYGAKGFMLSMIETAAGIAGDDIKQWEIERILSMGRELIERPVVLLDGVRSTLESLYEAGFRLIVATKGDLLDQERKLQNSGLMKYFDHIEIMSAKTRENYKRLVEHLDIQPDDFLMVGNSMRSDILPVLAMGGHCVYIPYYMTWAHEMADHKEETANLTELENISEMKDLLGIDH